MGLSAFVASTPGRDIRVVAGMAMVAVVGLLGEGWWALAVVGLVPLAATDLGMRLIDVLLGQPLRGTAVRAVREIVGQVRPVRLSGPSSSPTREVVT